jgi:hypothetical protein
MPSKPVKIGAVELTDEQPMHPDIQKAIESNGARAGPARGIWLVTVTHPEDGGKQLKIKIDASKAAYRPEPLITVMDGAYEVSEEIAVKVPFYVAVKKVIADVLAREGWQRPSRDSKPSNGASSGGATGPAPATPTEKSEDVSSKAAVESPALAPAAKPVQAAQSKALVATAKNKPAEKADANVLALIKSAAEQLINFCVLLYGPPGTGKTWLSCTPSRNDCDDKILVVDVNEQGTAGLRGKKNVFVAQIKTWKEFDQLISHFEKNGHDYDRIVIDTVTALSGPGMEHIMELTGTKATSIGTVPRHVWIPFYDLMEDTALRVRDLAPQSVFVFHDKEDKGDDDEDKKKDKAVMAPRFGPESIGKVPKIFSAKAQVVGQCYIRPGGGVKNGRYVKGTYCLGIGINPEYSRKIRLDPGIDVPDHIDDPTMEKLIAVIDGMYKE